MRQYPQAMRIYKIADKIGNLSLGNKLTLGYVCLRCGCLEEARKHLMLCSTLTKRGSADRNQVNNILALVSWKEGNLDDAIEILEDVMDSGYQTTVVYQNLGIFYNLKDDAKKALSFNLAAYDYNSDDPIICAGDAGLSVCRRGRNHFCIRLLYGDCCKGDGGAARQCFAFKISYTVKG